MNKLLSFEVQKDDIGQVLDWFKSVLALDSVAIGSIAFTAQPGVLIPLQLKLAALVFALSALLVFLAMAILIAHKRSDGNTLTWWRGGIVGLAYLTFASGIILVLWHIFHG